MTSRTRRVLPAMILGAAVASAPLAYAQDAASQPTQAEMMAQIEALRAKVEQLETKTVNSKDVDATVESVLRDANKRSQLMQAGAVTAGYEKGKAFFRSEDGNFYLNPNLQFQFRDVTNYRDDVPQGDDPDTNRIENGMEIRRMKIAFGGHAFTPKLTYNFQFAFSRSGGTPTLEDAWVKYMFADTIGFRVGQMKDITFHEEFTSSKRQLAVDRSLMNEVLAGGLTDFVQVVHFIYEDANSPVRFEGGLTDGVNSDNTNFQDPPANAAHFGVDGRLDFFVMGDRKQYDDFTAMNNKTDLLVFGAGAHFTQSGDGNSVFHTVDAQWENQTGTSVYGAFVGIWSEEGDSDSSYSWGGLGQVAQMLGEQWEIFGRYDYTNFDGGTSDDVSFSEVTIGANYYFSGHAAKCTVDVVYLPDGAPGSGSSGIGVLGGDDTQFAIRGQFQLLI